MPTLCTAKKKICTTHSKKLDFKAQTRLWAITRQRFAGAELSKLLLDAHAGRHEDRQRPDAHSSARSWDRQAEDTSRIA